MAGACNLTENVNTWPSQTVLCCPPDTSTYSDLEVSWVEADDRPLQNWVSEASQCFPGEDISDSHFDLSQSRESLFNADGQGAEVLSNVILTVPGVSGGDLEEPSPSDDCFQDLPGSSSLDLKDAQEDKSLDDLLPLPSSFFGNEILEEAQGQQNRVSLQGLSVDENRDAFVDWLLEGFLDPELSQLQDQPLPTYQTHSETDLLFVKIQAIGDQRNESGQGQAPGETGVSSSSNPGAADVDLSWEESRLESPTLPTSLKPESFGREGREAWKRGESLSSASAGTFKSSSADTGLGDTTSGILPGESKATTTSSAQQDSSEGGSRRESETPQAPRRASRRADLTTRLAAVVGKIQPRHNTNRQPFTPLPPAGSFDFLGQPHPDRPRGSTLIPLEIHPCGPHQAVRGTGRQVQGQRQGGLRGEGESWSQQHWNGSGGVANGVEGDMGAMFGMLHTPPTGGQQAASDFSIALWCATQTRAKRPLESTRMDSQRMIGWDASARGGTGLVPQSTPIAHLPGSGWEAGTRTCTSLALQSHSLGAVEPTPQVKNGTGQGTGAQVVFLGNDWGDLSTAAEECVFVLGQNCITRHVAAPDAATWRQLTSPFTFPPSPVSGTGASLCCSLRYTMRPTPSRGIAIDASILPPRPSNPSLRRRIRDQLYELAKAYATDDTLKMRTLTSRLTKVSSPQGCANQKLAHYMLLALEMRREGKGGPAGALTPLAQGLSQPDLNIFLEKTGWSAFAEMVSTYSVIHGLKGCSRVHLILVNDITSIAWDALFRELASQPGGAPHVRITTINFIFPDAPWWRREHVSKLSAQIHRAAERHGVPVVHNAVHAVHTTFHPGLIPRDPLEATAVVSCWSLMVFPDSSVLRSNPRNALLKWIYSLSPKVFVLIESDADFNGPFFLTRFKELMERGANMFEILDSMIPANSPGRPAFEFLFAQDMINCVACEGLDRFLRMERMEQWQLRLESVGFVGEPLCEEVWEGLSVLSGLDQRLKVERCNGVARMRLMDVPVLFASAWIPG